MRASSCGRSTASAICSTTSGYRDPPGTASPAFIAASVHAGRRPPKRKTENEKRKTENGKHNTDDKIRTTKYGQRKTDNETLVAFCAFRFPLTFYVSLAFLIVRN